MFFTTAEPLVDEDVEANCPIHDGLGEVGCVDIYERDLASDALVIALDEIEDPQNFGAVIRSAVALGATAILWPERDSEGH